MSWRLWFALVAAALLAAPHAAGAATLRVFAAASLREAFEDVADLYRKRSPGQEVEFNFAGSQVLRTQLQQGAPADLFASADSVEMAAVLALGLADSSAVFARNRLVAVAPADGNEVRHISDLAAPGVQLALAAATVPAGRYTERLLENLERVPDCGAGFGARVAANVVSLETNVRAVLAKVALGEVDGGIVYATDAQSALGRIQVIEIPDSVNVAAEYSIALPRNSRRREEGARFLALVLGPAGRDILARRGFLVSR